MVLGVDVGGTFTDAVLLAPDGITTAKAPTTPDDQSAGVMAAVDAALDRAGARTEDVERFVHGMTVGTNALLENRQAKTALVATEGFVDLEELGRQARPELYRLCVGHPPPIVGPALRVGAPERSGPDGVITDLDEQILRERLEAMAGEGVEAVAVCLLWGFRHPEHESRAAAITRAALDGVHVSTSHETAGTFREYERFATTIVDAALSPLLAGYLARLGAAATERGLPAPEVMLSGGGVVAAETAAAHGSWTVLSGPAGGAVGAARAAADAGSAAAVGLDMGGTSCDISVTSRGSATMTHGSSVGGRALALPMVDVHTIGAGGGSIAWRDAGGALRVGPRSAGAVPGPACYGAGGGEPTVTDADVVLGYLDHGAALAGGLTLDRTAAESAIAALGVSLGLDVLTTAAGIRRVAAAEMATAVRVMTVERGIDPRKMALVAFGGAGPLHAVAIAEELGMTRVIVPSASGVLSAVGLTVAERRRDIVESVVLAGSEITRERVAAVVARLVEQGRADLGTPAAAARCAYELRYRGQAFELTVEAGTDPEPDRLRAAFDQAHRDRYGYADKGAELELVTIRVGVHEQATVAPQPAAGSDEPGCSTRIVVFGGRALETSVHHAPPAAVEGPAICRLAESTLVVPPGWHGDRHRSGAILLERS